jgi:hypothetical protein
MSDNDQQMPPVATISNSNTLTENSAQTIPMTEDGVKQLTAKVEDLRYQLKASEEELDMALEDLANIKGVDEERQEFVEMERKAWENPAVMNRMRRERENLLNKNYGDLFRRLGLPDEKLQELKSLMVDTQLQGWQNAVNGSDPSLTDEDRKELQQQAEDQQVEYEKQMGELLGAENYEIYNAYEERSQERFILTNEMQRLSADLGLSEEKEHELIDAMYEARKAVDVEYGINIAGATPGSVERMNQSLDTFNGYIESGRRVLSGSQAEQFETRMNETIEAIKTDLSYLRGDDDESL